MTGPGGAVARLILAELFEAEWPEPGAPGRIGGGPGRSGTPWRLEPFQEEASRRIGTILQERGGAILADAVGLGKTYVALDRIARLPPGASTIVIVPAPLRARWRALLRETAAGLVAPGSPRGPGRVLSWRVLSHTALSRGKAELRRVPDPDLLVVDEAHRFRNPRTRRYAALTRLVRDPGGERTSPPRVLLITATPINNAAADLYHLLRLFCRDDAFHDVGVPSLRGALDPDAGMGPAPGDAARILRAVMVRRTRATIEARYGSGSGSGTPLPGFPSLKPPAVVYYPSPVLAESAERIARLELSPYGPAPLLRMALLKRLDSSRAALRHSVSRLHGVLQRVHDAAVEGRWLAPGLARPHGASDDPFQLLLLELVAVEARPDQDPAAAADSIRRDLDLLDGLVLALADPDPKLLTLKERVLELLPDRVLVFTEFRATAAAAHAALARSCRVARIDGNGAWLGRHPACRGLVVRRFAPGGTDRDRSSGRQPGSAREAVDVLVATDVLAEGLDLQEARHVIHLDLPWNPVRILQRIGRIDRFGSPHQTIFTHLFAPAEGLDRILGLRRRLVQKLGTIDGTVGDDGAARLLEALGTARSDPASLGTALAAARDRERATEDAHEALRTLWVRIARPTAPLAAAGCGFARVVTGDPADRRAWTVAGTLADRWVVLARNAARNPATHRLLEARYIPGTGSVRVREAGPGAARLLEQALAGSTPGTHEPLDPEAEEAMLRFLQAESRATFRPAPTAPRGAGSRLARRVQQALADGGGLPDPDLLRRTNRVLGTLARPLPPGAERAVAAATLDLRHGEPLATVLPRVERVLTTDETAAAAASPGGRAPDLRTDWQIYAGIRFVGAENEDPSRVDDDRASG